MGHTEQVTDMSNMFNGADGVQPGPEHVGDVVGDGHDPCSKARYFSIMLWSRREQYGTRQKLRT